MSWAFDPHVDTYYVSMPAFELVTEGKKNIVLIKSNHIEKKNRKISQDLMEHVHVEQMHLNV